MERQMLSKSQLQHLREGRKIERDFPYLGEDFKSRQIPNTKIRGTVAQRPVSDLPLFATPPKEEQREMFSGNENSPR